MSHPAFRIALAALVASVAAATSADGSALRIDAAAGTGDNVNVVGIQAAWTPRLELPLLERHDIEPRAIGQIAYWRAHDDSDGNHSLADGSLLAALHWTLAPVSEYQPFLEPAFGIELLSHVKINSRDLTTAFQFGSQLAAGVVVARRCEVAVFVHHTSNGDIKLPNWGLTYAGILVRVPLR
jgi:hypothetical protein